MRADHVPTGVIKEQHGFGDQSHDLHGRRYPPGRLAPLHHLELGIAPHRAPVVPLRPQHGQWRVVDRQSLPVMR